MASESRDRAQIEAAADGIKQLNHFACLNPFLPPWPSPCHHVVCSVVIVIVNYRMIRGATKRTKSHCEKLVSSYVLLPTRSSAASLYYVLSLDHTALGRVRPAQSRRLTELPKRSLNTSTDHDFWRYMTIIHDTSRKHKHLSD